MKKIFTLVATMAVALISVAQSPQKMSYQCVVRNTSGALVTNHAVGLRISILKGSATGSVVFSETYSPVPQTNANGLLTIEIGSGTASVGTFSVIDWSSGPYFLKTETDPDGGTGYTIAGTTQLLSVPYALYAKTAANGFSGAWADITGKPTTLSGYGITDADGSITNELQTISLSGTLLTLSNGGGTVTLPSSGGGDNWGTQTVVSDATLTGAGTTASPLAVVNSAITPSWSKIQNIPAGFADGIDNVDDADNSITNEIQTLSLAGLSLSLSNGGGSVTIPGDNWGSQAAVTNVTLTGNGTAASPLRIAQQSATNGQVLKWNGTTSLWAPADDATGISGLTLPWSGSLSTGNPDSYAFSVISTVQNASAICGKNSSVGSYSGYGVYGESSAMEGSGVYGSSTSGTGVTGQGPTGVFAEGQIYGVNATGEIALQGISNEVDGYGLHCTATSTTGINYGVYGRSASASGYGVYGESQKFGVYGLSNGSIGRAVVGVATGSASIGVQGIATNPSSTGVWGEGSNQGVYGTSALETGKGVYGVASSATGENSGVYGETSANSGSGVYGTGPFTGVSGVASSETLGGHGVLGRAYSPNGDGVAGYAEVGTGVHGETGGLNKSGVYGLAHSDTGDNFGVTGQSRSATGTGVLGYSPRYGIYGASTANQGRAVVGEAQGTASIGVRGIATNTSSTGVMGEGSNYDFYANGPGVDYGTSSSVRWKKNIKLIPDPLEKIEAIRGVFFDWDKDHGGRHDVGVIAEEVGKVLPEIVVYEENGVDAIGLDYSKLTPLLIEAVKAQQEEIEILKREIELLKAK